MKSSTKRSLGFSFVCLCVFAAFSLSTTLYAAEKTPGTQGIQVQQPQTPASAKILKANPLMIAALKYSNLPAEFNSAKSNFDKGYNTLQIDLPKLSEAYGKWTNKWNECVNKAYTYDEQMAAGCLPNDSVETCLGKVVHKCSAGHYFVFIEAYYTVIHDLEILKFSRNSMQEGLKILTDYSDCLMNSWPKQTCQ
jgi:hypothetical protein